MEIIKNCGGSVDTILFNNNKVNQKFFGMFNLRNPWCTIDNIFLLFHLGVQTNFEVFFL